HGALHTLSYESKALGGKPRKLVVYTPPGYDQSPRRRYPVLYLLHGTGDDPHTWTSVGLAHRILDNLIADRKAVPMIVAMPDGPAADRRPDDPPGKNTQSFAADLLGDVLPLERIRGWCSVVAAVAEVVPALPRAEGVQRLPEEVPPPVHRAPPGPAKERL